MLIFPAIDLIGGKAVRLLRGEYEQMTVFREHPEEAAEEFEAAGAEWLHVVDLEGARDGGTPNLPTVEKILRKTKLKVELGGGVRSMETIERYLQAGVSRVILGTAAVENPDFAARAAGTYGEHVALGADLKDGKLAIRGWKETAREDTMTFCRRMQAAGMRTMICTDISRDGAMQGANHALYAELSEKLNLQLVASGGVSSMEDVRRLKELGLYGAIVGKALYLGAISLREAIEAAR